LDRLSAPPLRVPCPLCGVKTDAWIGDTDPLAVPCGHSLSEWMAEGGQMVGVQFGEFAGTQPPWEW